MTRTEIILRIIEIAGIESKIELMNYGTVRRMLTIDGMKIKYQEGSKSATNSYIPKFTLAAILYEIGNDNDRTNVIPYMTMRDYAYIKNKLNLPD